MGNCLIALRNYPRTQTFSTTEVGTIDMCEFNNFRYVNTSNVYNRGISDGSFKGIDFSTTLYSSISMSGSYKITNTKGVCVKVSGYTWGSRYCRFYDNGSQFYGGMDKAEGSDGSFIHYPIPYDHTLSWSSNTSNAYVYVYPLI